MDLLKFLLKKGDPIVTQQILEYCMDCRDSDLQSRIAGKRGLSLQKKDNEYSRLFSYTYHQFNN
jgi:hypothetical protein